MENTFESMKDKTALGEIRIVISQLQAILAKAELDVGKVKPIVRQSDIELIKDHLDLIVKYTRI